MKNYCTKSKLVIYFIPVVILLIPLVAMLFTKNVNWSIFDFIVAGLLLFSMTFAIDVIHSKIQTISIKILLIMITLLVIALVWLELAVGVFGTPFAGT